MGSQTSSMGGMSQNNDFATCIQSQSNTLIQKSDPQNAQNDNNIFH